MGDVYRLAAAATAEGYRKAGVADLLELQRAVDEAGDPVLGVVRWLVSRYHTARAQSVAQYLSRARTTARLFARHLVEPLDDPLVTACIVSLRQLDGPAEARHAKPIRQVDVDTLLAQTEEGWHAPIILLWRGAARAADVANLRVGSLWDVSPGVVGVDWGSSKTAPLGLPVGVELHLPPAERQQLDGLVAQTAPLLPVHARPLLFPGLTWGRIADLLVSTLGVGYTPHSFRQGAVARMLEDGHDLADVSLLTRHRTVGGLLHYARRPDQRTRTALRRVQHATGTPLPQ